MSISERKAKEKEDLRALIMDGAMEVFVTNGYEKTTIRMIAEQINYSVGTVYVYFKDKNAILHEIQAMGFRKLRDARTILGVVSDPLERLKVAGKLYIQFAIENPELYELMFTLKAPIDFLNEMEREWEEGKAAFSRLREIVRECMAQGHFQQQSLESLAFIVWSVLHGMSTLNISGRIKAVNVQDTGQLIENAYDHFVLILENI